MSNILINPYSVVAAGGGLPITADLWGHWDAAEGVTKDGSDLVSQWDDQSGNGRNFIQTTGADQPLWVADVGSDLNNLPVISFTGGASRDWMEVAGISFYEAGNQYEYTFFAVYTDMDQGGSNWGHFIVSQFDRDASGEYPTSNPEFAMLSSQRQGFTAARWYACSQGGSYIGNIYSTQWGFNDVDPHIIGTTFHNTWAGSGTSWGANQDNATVTCYPSLCIGYAGSNTGASANFFHLNSGKFGTVPTWGLQYKLAELIIYNNALSNADFTTMTTYLNTKYDVY